MKENKYTGLYFKFNEDPPKLLGRVNEDTVDIKLYPGEKITFLNGDGNKFELFASLMDENEDKKICDGNYEEAMHYDCDECAADCPYRKGELGILPFIIFLGISILITMISLMQ